MPLRKTVLIQLEKIQAALSVSPETSGSLSAVRVSNNGGDRTTGF